MVSEIRDLINATPFVPFTIHTANGQLFRVPTVDHIAVPPTGRPVFVFGDNDGKFDMLSPLLIAHLSVESGEIVPPTGA